MATTNKKKPKKLMTKKGQKSKALPDLPQGQKHPWEPNDIVTFNVPVNGIVTRLVDLRFHQFSVAQRYAIIKDLTASLQRVMSPEFEKSPEAKVKKL